MMATVMVSKKVTPVSKRLRVMQVTDQSVLVGECCAACPKRVESGQWVAYRRNSIEEALSYEHYFLIHVRCMAALVGKAGRDLDEVAFDAERERIMKTGQLWPST